MIEHSTIKAGKTAGLDCRLVLFRLGGEVLTKVFNSFFGDIWNGKRIPLSCDESLVRPIYSK